ITRRIDEYHKHKDSGVGFGRLPDLILLDGGKGHVAAIEPVIRESGLSIPIFGMVKDDKHRTRAIAKDGGEIAISGNRAAFTLVSSIQEEVHRFAITYHRTSRGKSIKGSSLTKIDGIGEARARALIKHFRTISAIKEASVEQLAEVDGMNKRAAQTVYDYYRGESE
ncbi:MAG: excinuclease ABC subunit UvrC, partial [Clostridia bacterium]|nr:excinuclease ABC subunit UvrC [Clostridia bacterium]